MRVEGCEFNGDLIIKCSLDGVEVELLDPAWTTNDFLTVTGRAVGGAAILNAFLPGAGLIAGGAIGAFSFIKGKGEGYYDHLGTKVHGGRLHRSDFDWS